MWLNILDCPGLTPPTDGTINSTAVKQGTEVGVECDPDYTLFGAFLLTCQSDATWDSPVPECKQGMHRPMVYL